MLHVVVDALELASVKPDGKHHDLHHTERRDQEPFQRRTLFDDFGFRHVIWRQRLWLVAKRGKPGEHVAEADGFGIPGDLDPMRHRVYIR